MGRLLRRQVLRAFGTLLPGVAAAWFERMILTPRVARQADHTPLPPGSDRSRLPYGNGWLEVWSWGAGPTVLLMHGWGGVAASLGGFVEPLRAAGFRVVTYDAPAHGASDGERTNLLECAGAALQVARAFGPLHGVVAHSFGGPTAALAAQYGLTFDRLVLLGPPLSVYDLTMEMGDMIGLPRRVSELMARRVADRLRLDWTELRTDQLVAGLDVPVTVIHDEDDRVVPYDHGVEIARAAKAGTLVTTSGLGHRGTLTAPLAVERAVRALAVTESPARRPPPRAALPA